jgi:hypothetical protein
MRPTCTVALLVLLGAALAGCRQEPQWMDAAPEKWQRVGPCEVSIDSVRLGKVQIRSAFGAGESSEDVFIIRTLFRNTDPKITLKYMPWQCESITMSTTATLTDGKGQKYLPVVAFGSFATVEGRQKEDVVVSAGDAPVADLLTFEAKAAEAETLLLELPARWLQQEPNGWRLTGDGKFRFRLARRLWQMAREDPPK